VSSRCLGPQLTRFQALSITLNADYESLQGEEGTLAQSCLLEDPGRERSCRIMSHLNLHQLLQGDPVGALVRSCLLEDRGGERSFSYAPPASSGSYLVKWSFHNVRLLPPVSRAFCVYASPLPSLLDTDPLWRSLAVAQLSVCCGQASSAALRCSACRFRVPQSR
jgi:hypothetical protein